MKQNVKWALVGVVVIGAVIYLLISGLSSHGMYYAEVSEINSDPTKFIGKGARVSGLVTQGSLDKRAANDIIFTVKDNLNDSVMKVHYKGIVPDAFKEDISVIIEGKYNSTQNIFEAKTLLAKCPSRYEGMDAEEHEKARAEYNAGIDN